MATATASARSRRPSPPTGASPTPRPSWPCCPTTTTSSRRRPWPHLSTSSAATRRRHGVGVAPGVEERAGRGAGESAVVDDARAVDEDGLDAFGVGVEPAGVAGEVGSRALGAVADGVGVEEHEVGGPAVGDAATVLEAVQAGGDVGELVDRFLEGDDLLLADAVLEQCRRVDGAAHHVEMGPG